MLTITTTVLIDGGSSFAYAPDAAAAQVLAALGGDPTEDRATVTVQQHDSGEAGVPLPVPPPPVAGE